MSDQNKADDLRLSSMDPELRAKWVTALRDGSYRQGIGQLRRRELDCGISFCCLGVLCDIAKVKYDGTAAVPDREISAGWGLPARVISVLIGLNDGGNLDADERALVGESYRGPDEKHSFADIAKFIEQKL